MQTHSPKEWVAPTEPYNAVKVDTTRVEMIEPNMPINTRGHMVIGGNLLNTKFVYRVQRTAVRLQIRSVEEGPGPGTLFDCTV